MIERPIIFSGPMVPAILDRGKTQTRRVIRLRDATQTYSMFDDDGQPLYMDDMGDWLPEPCPYGVPGDRLWVREALRRSPYGVPVRYAADGAPVFRDGETLDAWPWKRPCLPSIHMPRWASRITLEVTKTRIQHVQDISEEDARAEGFAYREHFIRYWDLLNAKRGYGFDEDPWVRVVTFRRSDNV